MSGTNAQLLDERRDAARCLLVRPILTEAAHPDELALVRRHATALRAMFASTLGYRLITEASFARLVKAPLSPDTAARPAYRGSAKGAGPSTTSSPANEFTPPLYTYLALVSAGLLAPGVGEQLLLSQLVEQLRADAAAAHIAVSDTLTERRALVGALTLLISWGVLTETDGTVAGWGERHDDALLTVNRAMLPHLLTRPMHALTGPTDLLQQPSEADAQPRRELRRRLVENPLTRREDLTDAERDVLSRERTELSHTLEDNFGLRLEVRAEGALTYDPADELTDRTFPGQGTVRQAALLLLDALVDSLRPRPGSTADVAGRAVPGVLAPWPLVTENVTDLAERHRTMWRADAVANPGGLQEDIVELLTGLDLARVTDDGLVLHPACARYRPEPHRAQPSTRAQRRLQGSSTLATGTTTGGALPGGAAPTEYDTGTLDFADFAPGDTQPAIQTHSQGVSPTAMDPAAPRASEEHPA